MIPRFRGKVGEYMWEKEQQRLERYKDRPWELQSRNQSGNPLIALAMVLMVVFALLLLLSLF